MSQFNMAERRTDDLLGSFKHQCTNEAVFSFYVPKDTREDDLKEVADCVDKEIEAYGQEHAYDFAKIDELEIIERVLDRLGVPYHEPTPNYVFYL